MFIRVGHLASIASLHCLLIFASPVNKSSPLNVRASGTAKVDPYLWQDLWQNGYGDRIMCQYYGPFPNHTKTTAENNTIATYSSCLTEFSQQNLWTWPGWDCGGRGWYIGHYLTYWSPVDCYNACHHCLSDIVNLFGAIGKCTHSAGPAQAVVCWIGYNGGENDWPSE